MRDCVCLSLLVYTLTLLQQVVSVVVVVAVVVGVIAGVAASKRKSNPSDEKGMSHTSSTHAKCTRTHTQYSCPSPIVLSSFFRAATCVRNGEYAFR